MKLLKLFTNSHDHLKTGTVDTVIGSTTIFVGTLETNNSVCIEGKFKGQLGAKGSVLINQNAIVDGDITAEYVAIHGKVTGQVSVAKQLDIAATGMLRGDVESPSVTIAKGGILDGFCKMVKGEVQHAEVPPPISFQKAAESQQEEGFIEPMENDAPGMHVEDRKRIHIIDDEDDIHSGLSGTEAEKY